MMVESWQVFNIAVSVVAAAIAGAILFKFTAMDTRHAASLTLSIFVCAASLVAVTQVTSS